MNDAINGILELVGAFFLLTNCMLLYHHKRVQGISVYTTVFFTTWGLWNLYFYPANKLWLSFAGGALPDDCKLRLGGLGVILPT